MNVLSSLTSPHIYSLAHLRRANVNYAKSIIIEISQYEVENAPKDLENLGSVNRNSKYELFLKCKLRDFFVKSLTF